MEAPRSAQGASGEDLLELVQRIRRELSQRREAPAGDWVEGVANDLRSGRRTGWIYPPATGGGLAFYSAREEEAFGHVHIEAGPEDEERAFRLAEALLAGLPASIRSIDVGWTGLPPEGERRVLERLASARPGSTIIERTAMERAITAADSAEIGGPPAGLVLVPLTDVTVEALAELDRRAFAGTVDELLVGSRIEDHQRVMRSLLEGDLGRFLSEASTALIVPDPPRLVGSIFSAEQSPRRAVFLSFMIDPADRRRGYGRYLLRWGIRALRALGYSSVHLWVTVANVGARALYAEHHFVPIARAAIYRWERSATGEHPHSGR